MSKTITLTEMHRSLADIMNQVDYRRKSFIIKRGNKEIAELRPVTKGIAGAELLEFWKNGPHLSPEDAEAFAEDYYAMKASERVEDYDPWER